MNFLLRKIFTSLFEGFAIWRNSKNHSSLMQTLRKRIVFSSVFGALVFLSISYELADIMVISRFRTRVVKKNFIKDEIIKRADIVDRNGELLATSIRTSSCYADPSVVIDADETAAKLSNIQGMPDADKIKQKLADKNKHFVWLLRHVTPKVQETVMNLGLPGIHFQKDYKRIYIQDNLFSHVIGCCNVDGIGVCGLEKEFSNELNKAGNLNKKLVTTFSLQLQTILHEEMKEAIGKYRAVGGNAILMSTKGEILAMISLPDFNPNDLKNSSSDAMFNRNTLAVVEQGSVSKILTVAIALDSGSAALGSVFDASEPIRVGRFSINDFRGKKRRLTLAEAFVFSSNIASAKMAQNFGVEVQKAYMKKFGMLDKVNLEIQEVGKPLIPRHWSEATMMTVSYGYGLAVSPLTLLAAVSSIVNDGIRVKPTLIYGKRQKFLEGEDRVVSSQTSKIARDLMRAVVCFGTARKAAIDGVDIIAKTGTAYKTQGKSYGVDGQRKRVTTLIGGFPKDKPEYMLLVSIDDPKPTPDSFGFATAGYN
ncbi:MAG: penicillin-binding protein 2, partial [Holosporales bacterium]|nr:penicillin-binding protein 2 [Holosporales bacterium]